MSNLILTAILCFFSGVGIGATVLYLIHRSRNQEADNWKCDNCGREIADGEIYYTPKRLPFLKKKKYCERCDFGERGIVRAVNNIQSDNGEPLRWWKRAGAWKCRCPVCKEDANDFYNYCPCCGKKLGKPEGVAI